MLVFACETSCDETSICLMEDKKIVEHVIFSQDIHSKHGGVVPELASRNHLEKLQEITDSMFKKPNIDPNKIDVFSATCGPGLIGPVTGLTLSKDNCKRSSKEELAESWPPELSIVSISTVFPGATLKIGSIELSHPK